MNVTVLGAGIVGICVATTLQQEGHSVTLIDRDEPGTGCSFGNAGMIQCSSVVPLATPGVVGAVPRMLLDPKQPLVIRWDALAHLFPFLMRFLAAARPAKVEEISAALATIVPRAYDAYEPLLRAAGAHNLVRKAGELYVYKSTASFTGGGFPHELRRRQGIKVQDIPLKDLYDLEPALARDFKHAVYLPKSYQTADPLEISKALVKLFVGLGGKLARETVNDIVIGPDGPKYVETNVARHRIDRLVLAMGAYSGALARKLGSPVPLRGERGYHLMLPDPGVSLRTSVISGDYKFGIVQMQHGIRLAGTAELARLDAAPNHDRARRLLPLAQEILPGLGGAEAKPWMGHRPSMPDSLPVICRSPRHRAVYFAFGHGHSGLTLGAMTGRIIGDLVAGRTPELDIAPFDVRRFG